ncbi:GNAT family N-acetyltransferase [Pseudogemmobacter sp. W21_MBD1_M6]|uniref:GNAT family N-acetyltransferase n=1 Tax=Pseudogemmobacter sp. W21_MBD1_M6 TaxID=3240271 RepID=UPI003F99D0B0
MTGAKVRVVETQADLDLCLAIRRKVFVEEQKVPAEDEWDDQDAACTHFLAVHQGEVSGTARLAMVDGYAKIQRVAVLPFARGTGLGATIMREVIAHIRTGGTVGRVVLGAQIHAVGFYQKLGFEPFGDIYLDAGITHRDMALTL